jgi:hypothetical protein
MLMEIHRAQLVLSSDGAHPPFLLRNPALGQLWVAALKLEAYFWRLVIGCPGEGGKVGVPSLRLELQVKGRIGYGLATQ